MQGTPRPPLYAQCIVQVKADGLDSLLCFRCEGRVPDVATNYRLLPPVRRAWVEFLSRRLALQVYLISTTLECHCASLSLPLATLSTLNRSCRKWIAWLPLRSPAPQSPQAALRPFTSLHNTTELERLVLRTLSGKVCHLRAFDRPSTDFAVSPPRPPAPGSRWPMLQAHSHGI